MKKGVLIFMALLVLALLILLALSFDSRITGRTISILGGNTLYDSNTQLASVEISRSADDVELEQINVIFYINENTADFNIPKDKILNPGESFVYKFNLSGKGAPQRVAIITLGNISSAQISEEINTGSGTSSSSGSGSSGSGIISPNSPDNIEDSSDVSDNAVPQNNEEIPKSDSSKNWGMIYVIIAGIAILILVVVVILILLIKRKRDADIVQSIKEL